MIRFLDFLYVALKVAITLLIAALIVPVTMQVLSRYTGLVPRFIWTEELARFCFVWMIMVGSMIAVRDDTHFDVDLLPVPETARALGLSKLVRHLAMAGLAVAFLWYGRPFVNQGLMQTSEIAELPMVTIYIAWPLAGAVWLVFLIEKIVRDVRYVRMGPVALPPYDPIRRSGDLEAVEHVDVPR
ncbi:TRAP transporter small permease [Acuticoccus sediminis]|uniref:TRAP transporter small permease n=1 Tax=Acuticoccus sediminis TaxID=2184697 RepID=UPI001CFF0E11|nr:TRAP transporter small permease [Acuticoccus sediminis]